MLTTEELETIRARNWDANVYCRLMPTCPQFRCEHTRADINTLLAEVERLQNEIGELSDDFWL